MMATRTFFSRSESPEAQSLEFEFGKAPDRGMQTFDRPQQKAHPPELQQVRHEHCDASDASNQRRSPTDLANKQNANADSQIEVETRSPPAEQHGLRAGSGRSSHASGGTLPPTKITPAAAEALKFTVEGVDSPPSHMPVARARSVLGRMPLEASEKVMFGQYTPATHKHGDILGIDKEDDIVKPPDETITCAVSSSDSGITVLPVASAPAKPVPTARNIDSMRATPPSAQPRTGGCVSDAFDSSAIPMTVSTAQVIEPQKGSMTQDASITNSLGVETESTHSAPNSHHRLVPRTKSSNIPNTRRHDATGARFSRYGVKDSFQTCPEALRPRNEDYKVRKLFSAAPHYSGRDVLALAIQTLCREDDEVLASRAAKDDDISHLRKLLMERTEELDSSRQDAQQMKARIASFESLQQRGLTISHSLADLDAGMKVLKGAFAKINAEVVSIGTDGQEIRADIDSIKSSHSESRKKFTRYCARTSELLLETDSERKLCQLRNEDLQQQLNTNGALLTEERDRALHLSQQLETAMSNQEALTKLIASSEISIKDELNRLSAKITAEDEHGELLRVIDDTVKCISEKVHNPPSTEHSLGVIKAMITNASESFNQVLVKQGTYEKNMEPFLQVTLAGLDDRFNKLAEIINDRESMDREIAELQQSRAIAIRDLALAQQLCDQRARDCERLGQSEIRLGDRNLHLHAELQALKEQRSSEANTREKLHDLMADNHRLQQKLEDAQSELAELKEAASAPPMPDEGSLAQLMELKSHLESSRTRIEELEQRNQHLEATDESLSEITKVNKELVHKIARAKEQCDEAVKNAQDFQGQCRAEASAAQAAASQKTQELVEARVSAEKEKKAAECELKYQRDKSAQLLSERDQASQQLSDLRSQLKDQKESYVLLKAQFDESVPSKELVTAADATKEELEHLKDTCEKLSSERSRLLQARQAAEKALATREKQAEADQKSAAEALAQKVSELEEAQKQVATIGRAATREPSGRHEVRRRSASGENDEMLDVTQEHGNASLKTAAKPRRRVNRAANTLIIEGPMPVAGLEQAVPTASPRTIDAREEGASLFQTQDDHTKSKMAIEPQEKQAPVTLAQHIDLRSSDAHREVIKDVRWSQEDLSQQAERAHAKDQDSRATMSSSHRNPPDSDPAVASGLANHKRKSRQMLSSSSGEGNSAMRNSGSGMHLRNLQGGCKLGLTQSSELSDHEAEFENLTSPGFNRPPMFKTPSAQRQTGRASFQDELGVDSDDEEFSNDPEQRSQVSGKLRRVSSGKMKPMPQVQRKATTQPMTPTSEYPKSVLKKSAAQLQPAQTQKKARKSVRDQSRPGSSEVVTETSLHFRSRTSERSSSRPPSQRASRTGSGMYGTTPTSSSTQARKAKTQPATTRNYSQLFDSELSSGKRRKRNP